MSQLSKTARQAVQAGEGAVKRTPVAWGYFRVAGKLHKRPDVTFFSVPEAEKWAEKVGDRGYVVTAADLNKNTVRR